MKKINFGKFKILLGLFLLLFLLGSTVIIVSNLSKTKDVRTRAAPAGIAFDSASSVVAPAELSPAKTDSFSLSHATGGSDRALFVGVTSFAAVPVSSVKYAGLPLTFIRADQQSANISSEIWFMVKPPLGTNNVSVTMASEARFIIAAASFTGVAQTSTINTSSGANSFTVPPHPSVTLGTAASNVWIIDTASGFGSGDPETATTLSPGASQTQRWNTSDQYLKTNNMVSAGSTKKAPTPGNYTISWTMSHNRPWAISAVAFKPAVQPPPPPSPSPPPPSDGDKPPPSNGGWLPSLPGGDTITDPNILNFLKLKISVPYLLGKMKVPVFFKGFSKEIQVSPGVHEYKIDVGKAKVPLGKSLDITIGGNKTLIKKVTIKTKAPTMPVNIDNLILGDITGDNKINDEDITTFLDSLKNKESNRDINLDGVSNSMDWAILLVHFGRIGNR